MTIISKIDDAFLLLIDAGIKVKEIESILLLEKDYNAYKIIRDDLLYWGFPVLLRKEDGRQDVLIKLKDI